MSSPQLLSRSLLLGGALFAPILVRADEPAPLGTPILGTPIGAPDASETVRPLSQREFSDAASTQIGFLAELRAWRNTLRGVGARRDWALSPRGDQKIAISLGSVAPATLGGGAGVAAKWRGVEIGTTAQPEAVDAALSHFDSLMSGEKTPAPATQTQLNWLRAQLGNGPGAQVEIMAARAAREGVSGSTWREGEFASARARLQLPAHWSLSGDYNRASVERGGQTSAASVAGDAGDASAWSIAAAGPIAHPFGVARASAQWQSVGAGYLAPTAQNGAAGGQNGSLEVAQDLKIGVLSGQLNFGAATQHHDAIQSAATGEQLAQSARSAAQMRLALTPNLSVTGSGQWNTSAATRALNAGKTDEDAALTPAQERELSRQLAGDVGVQWNFSRALSLAASMGKSSQNSQLEGGEMTLYRAPSDEVRRALELRQKSGASDLRLRFSQRVRTTSDSKAQTPGEAPVSQWRLEAARPLIAGVRLKTILDYASDEARGESARRIEAQLQLARAARFDARYRQGNLSPGLLSDEWNSTFAPTSSASKQWSTRLGLGSAASGAGLGLSVEMVRSQGAQPDSYRVGVQFK